MATKPYPVTNTSLFTLLKEESMRLFNGARPRTKFTPVEAPKQPNDVYFGLSQENSELVVVKALNSDGSPVAAGDLVGITPKGAVLATDVNPSLGFYLDDEGSIELAETKKDNHEKNILPKLVGEKPSRPKYWPWELAIDHCPDGAVRVIAVNPANGKRYKNGNLVKFLPNGTVYFYHTIEPMLGMPLDMEGRLVIL